MTFDAILFDMGNVLLRFSHERMWEQLAVAVGRPRAEIESLFLGHGLFEAYDRGVVNETEVLGRLEALAGKSLEPAAIDLAISDIFTPLEPMARLVAAAKESGVRLVLLSNTCRPHFEFVNRTFPELLAPFDAFTLSYEIGAIKPEPAIFAAAIEKAQVPAKRCFYTDDIMKYVSVARELGIDAETFIDPPNLVSDLARRGLDLSAVLAE
ncbi:MAG TPA: HAD family phosphatase [Planctomycetia bacterium]|nr:HAD family phosphatase [Planctomycetia bacterium]